MAWSQLGRERQFYQEQLIGVWEKILLDFDYLLGKYKCESLYYIFAPSIF